MPGIYYQYHISFIPKDSNSELLLQSKIENSWQSIVDFIVESKSIVNDNGHSQICSIAFTIYKSPGEEELERRVLNNLYTAKRIFDIEEMGYDQFREKYGCLLSWDLIPCSVNCQECSQCSEISIPMPIL